MSQIGAYEARGPQRSSRVGTWQTLAGPDGQLRGGLRLDKVLLDQGIADRLSEAVRAVRVLNLPGLNSLIDQMYDGQYLWLVSSVPASPTVSSLTNLPAPVATLIAVDIGQTLAALHSANLAHGDVSTDTVVVTVEGRAVLLECGYAHALAGTVPGPGHDVNGWVSLVRFLAAASGNNQLLLNVASQAEGIGGSAGLNAALASLTAATPQVPGYGERGALAVLATAAPTPNTPAAQAPATAALTTNTPATNTPATNTPSTNTPSTNTPATNTPATNTPATDTPATVALATAPAAASAPIVPLAPATPESVTVRLTSADDGAMPTISPAELETRLGKRNEEVLRFGRGVASPRPPQEPAPTPAWRGSTAPYPVTERSHRSRKRLISIFSGLITVVILAIVGYFVVQRLTPLQITSVAVGIAQPLPANACDIRVDVIGTVTSNGGGGSFTYRWVRSDGAATQIFTETVPFGTKTTQVHLFWQFGGQGSLKAKATLEILSPQTAEISTEFTYNCK